MNDSISTETGFAAWKTLRSKVVSGDTLTPSEAAIYAAGEAMLDAQEASELRAGAEQDARTLQQDTARLEAEAEQLRETSRMLAERIRVLETRLKPLLPPGLLGNPATTVGA
jgi:FtsZ-binding cell division protein ZapB